MKGIYQHCAKRHPHRYLAEYDFRYSFRAANDGERSVERFGASSAAASPIGGLTASPLSKAKALNRITFRQLSFKFMIPEGES